MKKYVKPDYELKTITEKNVVVSVLNGWLADNNLSDVGITTANLNLVNS